MARHFFQLEEYDWGAALEAWKGLVERSLDAEAFLGTAAKAHLPTVWIVERSRPWQIVARVKMLSNFFQTVFYWAEIQAKTRKEMRTACQGRPKETSV